MWVSGQLFALSSWLLWGLGFGLGIGLLSGLNDEFNKWIRRSIRNVSKSGPGCWLLYGLGCWLLYGLLSGQLFELLQLLGGLLAALSVGLVFGLPYRLHAMLRDGFTISEIRTRSFPNEGIRRSIRNASIIGPVCGLLYGLGVGLPCGLGVGLPCGLGVGLPCGLGVGLPCGLGVGLGVGAFLGLNFGLRFGGRAYLHHYALRLVLWHKDFAPLHYIRFLDYAAARIFLRKVGGGYVFVHRMLLDYFVAMPQTSA
jgi:hypothetical protein